MGENIAEKLLIKTKYVYLLSEEKNKANSQRCISSG
jgi:hypothetical protein